MKNWKKSLCLILAVLMSASMIACGGSGKQAGGGRAKDEFTTDAGTKMPGAKVEKDTLTILGDVSWQLKENGYIYEFFKKYYGVTIESIPASAETVYTQLVAKINAGTDIPDLVIAHKGFPSLPAMGYIDSVNELEIDFSLDFMKNTESVYNQYVYGGKNYYLPMNAYAYEYVYYNSKVFEDNGLKTPKELFMDNEWTVDKLYEYAKKLNTDSNGDGQAERWGLALPTYHGSRLVMATGKTLTYMDGTKLVNNIADSALQGQFEKLYKAVNVDKVAPTNGDIDYNCQLLNNGQAAMCIGPMFWMEEDYFPNLLEAKTFEWAPMPKDPTADDYYVAGDSTGFYMPTGSKNTELIKAFIYSCSAAWQEQLETSSQWHQYDVRTYLSKYSKYGYTEEDYKADNNYSKQVAKHYKLVVQLTEDVVDPSEILTMLNDEKSYQQMLAEMNPTIETKISELYDNSKLTEAE